VDLQFESLPNLQENLAIVRRTIVKGKYVRRLANASARTPARDQLIDRLSVVLGSRRGCFGFEAQNKNNNSRAT
jgi:hypothetical protein